MSINGIMHIMNKVKHQPLGSSESNVRLAYPVELSNVAQPLQHLNNKRLRNQYSTNLSQNAGQPP